jgi:hypothetical protein
MSEPLHHSITPPLLNCKHTATQSSPVLFNLLYSSLVSCLVSTFSTLSSLLAASKFPPVTAALNCSQFYTHTEEIIDKKTLTHSPTHSFISFAFIHSLTHSLTHSRCP